MKAFNTKIFELIKGLMWLKKLKVLLTLFLFNQILFAQNIDIGIFESAVTSDQIEIIIRPDFDIAEDETITAILYTVKWNDSAITINTEFIFPFFISPQGDPVEDNGYFYQVFAAVPVNPIAILANEEFIASSFTFTNGECATFEIIEDQWTQANNGNVYFEFLGNDVSGIIYEPNVEFGSVGGIITGGGTINLGESTGILTLADYSGNINLWQSKLNEEEWLPISSTSGLVDYSEIPISTGIWQYRCELQHGDCDVVYSDLAQVIVLDTLTNIPDSFKIENNDLKVSSNGKNILIKNLSLENLEGKIMAYNLLGVQLLDGNVTGSNEYSFHLHVQGIVIVNYIDAASGILHLKKVLLK